jgi:putative NADPH-quinone reductase
MLAEAVGADLFEILPETPYTRADLNWMNRKSRSIVEMMTPGMRPPVTSHVEDMSQYDVIFLGFPVWCDTVPTIVQTFLEGYDLTGKRIITFATSGGGGMGHSEREVSGLRPRRTGRAGKLLNGRNTVEGLREWAAGFEV